VRGFQRTNKWDSRATEREEHDFNTPVQSNTHTAYRNSFTCLCPLIESVVGPEDKSGILEEDVTTAPPLGTI